MRFVSALLLGAMLAGCTAVPPPQTRDPRKQQEFLRLTGDKVAGPHINCVPSYSQSDMTIIDGHTIAFRIGTGSVDVVTLSDGCGMVGVGGYALKTQSFGQGLCSGDIATVIDPLNNGMTVGSCAIGPITPYMRRR